MAFGHRLAELKKEKIYQKLATFVPTITDTTHCYLPQCTLDARLVTNNEECRWDLNLALKDLDLLTGREQGSEDTGDGTNCGGAFPVYMLSLFLCAEIIKMNLEF